MQLHRGRLIDHIQLVVRDIEASKRFYKAAFDALGIPLGDEGPDFFWADELFISTPTSRAARGELTGRVHLAFQAASREQVDAFYAAGTAAGATDGGAPGERKKYHPGYYAAFLVDPDGNNIEAVFHGPAERSAKSVVVSFAGP